MLLKPLLTSKVPFAIPAEQTFLTLVAQQAFLALAGSIFVAACAHIAIPLPLTPVPFTLQPFAVLLVGMLLGPATGSAALTVYLCEGALGLPVFTPMGLPGIARLLGPTGGYLFVYPIAAAIAGLLPQLFAGRHRFATYTVGGALAMATIYAGGVFWFSHAMQVSAQVAFSGSVLPFAALDLVKVLAAAGMAASLPHLRSRT